MDLSGLRAAPSVYPAGSAESLTDSLGVAVDHAGYQKVLVRVDADVTKLDTGQTVVITFQEGDAAAYNDASWRNIHPDPNNYSSPTTVPTITLLPADLKCVRFGTIRTSGHKRYFRAVINSGAAQNGQDIFVTVTMLLLEPNIVVTDATAYAFAY